MVNMVNFMLCVFYKIKKNEGGAYSQILVSKGPVVPP